MVVVVVSVRAVGSGVGGTTTALEEDPTGTPDSNERNGSNPATTESGRANDDVAAATDATLSAKTRSILPNDLCLLALRWLESKNVCDSRVSKSRLQVTMTSALISVLAAAARAAVVEGMLMVV